jgi:hypothetical protein
MTRGCLNEPPHRTVEPVTPPPPTEETKSYGRDPDND